MNPRGVTLTLVIVVLLLLSLATAAAMNLVFQRSLLGRTAVNLRSQAYYHAKAGSVDAAERLRSHEAFEDPRFDPEPYTLDVDGDGTEDVTVDISAADPATGLRTVRSTGRD